MPSSRARTVAAVGLTMKPVGKPNAVNPRVRFDERGGGNGLGPTAQEPRRSSTLQFNGKKCHAMVDTQGLMLSVSVAPAKVQDRDSFLPLLKEVRRGFVYS